MQKKYLVLNEKWEGGGVTQGCACYIFNKNGFTIKYQFKTLFKVEMNNLPMAVAFEVIQESFVFGSFSLYYCQSLP